MKFTKLKVAVMFSIGCFSALALAENTTVVQGANTMFGSAGALLVKANQALLPQSLLVSWPDHLGSVTLFQSATPDQSGMKLLADKISGNSYLLTHAEPSRPYVFVKPEGQAGYWVAERILPLQGGVNFRDLGGYRTADGRAVVWGKLFRSGSMGDLTSADYQYLSQLKIKTFCDFRANEERTEEPTLYKEFAPEALMLNKDYSMQQMMNGDFAKQMAQIKTHEQAIGLFGGFYRMGATTYKDQFSTMFAQLLKGQAPLAVNCSAGKDRTGMASALILSALGVPRDVVVADYALSERAHDFGLREIKKQMKGGKQESPHNQFFRQLPPEVINVFMGTDPELIKAFFQQIEQDYGSVEVYLEKELAVGTKQLEQLRAMYLTAAV